MKAVLVTGGTVRLGKAIAEGLRADGWRVVTSSHRAGAGADIVADLAEPLGAAKLYAAALQMLGGQPPDALVNNAALFVGDEATVKAVNLEAPKKLTMMMAGRERGVGAVVNILDSVILGSSRVAVRSDSVGVGSDGVGVGSDGVKRGSDSVKMGAGRVMVRAQEAMKRAQLNSCGQSHFCSLCEDTNGFTSNPNRPSPGPNRPSPDSNRLSLDPKRPYLDSKRELLAYTRASAAAFAATLRVNGVAPGPVLAPTEVHEKAGETLLDRRPSPEDVAAAVSYLLSAEAVTGTVIPVDAGQHLLSE